MSGQVPTIALAFNDVSLTRAKHNNIHVHQSIVHINIMIIVVMMIGVECSAQNSF